MHALSMENLLLRMQNDGLKKRLVNKKKRRQRGKPLQLDFPTQNEGGAIFYSPNKVKQARTRQAQKDADADINRRQKEADKERREVEKAEKARLLQERKEIKAHDKEIRLREQGEKRRQKEVVKLAQLADQQIQTELKTARKGRKKAETSKNNNRREIGNAFAVDEGESQSVINGRGRKIYLPQRFRM